MKKLLATLTILAVTFLTSFGQNTKPYVGVGTSADKLRTENQVYNLEIGCRDAKTWYAVTFDFANKNKNQRDTAYVYGVKIQRAIMNLSQKTTVYSTASLKTSKDREFRFEPGLSVNYMFKPRFGVQTYVSTQFMNTISINDNFPLRAGVQVNYQLK